jgi:hypothetical protein
MDSMTSYATDTIAFRTANRELSRLISHQDGPSTSPRLMPVIAARRSCHLEGEPCTRVAVLN